MNIIEGIKQLNIGEIFENVNLKNYTTYKIDGIAFCVVYPSSISNLITLPIFLVIGMYTSYSVSNSGIINLTIILLFIAISPFCLDNFLNNVSLIFISYKT